MKSFLTGVIEEWTVKLTERCEVCFAQSHSLIIIRGSGNFARGPADSNIFIRRNYRYVTEGIMELMCLAERTQEEQDILEWLCPQDLDYSPTDMPTPTRSPTTWLFHEGAYTVWEQSCGSFLWLHGKGLWVQRHHLLIESSWCWKTCSCVRNGHKTRADICLEHPFRSGLLSSLISQLQRTFAMANTQTSKIRDTFSAVC